MNYPTASGFPSYLPGHAPGTKEPEIIVARLDLTQYKELVKSLPKLCVVNDPIQAATLVGIQLVLEKLREGWVIGR